MLRARLLVANDLYLVQDVFQRKCNPFKAGVVLTGGVSRHEPPDCKYLIVWGVESGFSQLNFRRFLQLHYAQSKPVSALTR